MEYFDVFRWSWNFQDLTWKTITAKKTITFHRFESLDDKTAKSLGESPPRKRRGCLVPPIWTLEVAGRCSWSWVEATCVCEITHVSWGLNHDRQISPGEALPNHSLVAYPKLDGLWTVMYQIGGATFLRVHRNRIRALETPADLLKHSADLLVVSCCRCSGSLKLTPSPSNFHHLPIEHGHNMTIFGWMSGKRSANFLVLYKEVSNCSSQSQT